MPTKVSTVPSVSLLADSNVGRTVTRAHGLSRTFDESFLLAHALCQPVVDQYLGTSLTIGDPVVVPVQYCRTPGARAVLVELLFWGGGPTSSVKVSVAVSAGSIGWLAQNGLDGTTELPAGDAITPVSTERPRRAILDVTGLDIGTIVDLAFTIDAVSNCSGLRHIKLIELPTEYIDPLGDPTGEAGVDGTWPAVLNRLTEGADVPEVGRGIRRIVYEMHRAHATRRCIQCTSMDDNSTVLFSTNSTSLVTALPDLLVRAQRYGSTSVKEKLTTRVLYRTSATTAGEFKVTDGTATSTLTLAASTSRTSVSADFDLLTNGTNQEISLSFTMKRTSGTGFLYLVGVAFFGSR